MKDTKLTTSPLEAAQYIINGGIVAFPTETVYGLGANVFDEAAVAEIFAAKQRPADNPLIAHVSNPEQIGQLAADLSEAADKLIDRFFPGPLTVVLRKRRSVPEIATAGLDSIGVRMPKNDLAREFLAACGTPVVAPSANLSGRPSPTTWQAVYEDLNRRIDCILQGEPTEIGLESTVVDCTGETPRLLRQGAISLEDIRKVVRATDAAFDLTAAARSPGMRHRHYSPHARVMIVHPDSEVTDYPYSGGKFGYIGFRPVDGRFSAVKVCSSITDYAHSLFEFFRECDRKNIDEIHCEAVEKIGIGAALMDRIERAAAANED
jgi:L-threonylcarbamoyladenylate synthase